MKVDANNITWGNSLDAQLTRLIERDFVGRRQRSPVYLPQYDSGNLPAPADWLGANIYVTDKGCNAVSNGAAWVRPDGTVL